MALWTPDPTFYASPRLAGQAPPEGLAYVVTLNPNAARDGRPDAVIVVDTDPASPTYTQTVGRWESPNVRDEFHHFGWNACSAALCPTGSHPHVERRYLLVPGLRSSNIYVLDIKPDPRRPQLVRTITAAEIANRTGYSRPHTLHCGPDGIYVSVLGNVHGDGPGGVFLLDCESFDVLGRWEVERGPQHLAYDFWWHLGYDTLITSEWGTPNMIEGGLNPGLLLAGKYGHHVHLWDLRRRRHLEALDLGAEQQMVLELRPAHDPTRPYGFVGVVVSLKDLSASVWAWHREKNSWGIRKVIEIPAEPADPDTLPPALKPFGAVPPLVTDIALSLDDRQLHVSCWGTGELRQYDVSDPFHPQQRGSVRLGGIVGRTPLAQGSEPLNGGPQMVEVSRDGRRVYLTNSLYSSWDTQFYPEGLDGWLVKLDADPNGGLTPDPDFFLTFENERPHQVRLQGGDASSDSYCFP